MLGNMADGVRQPSEPFCAEVVPPWVCRAYEVQLLSAAPAFQFLFARDCLVRASEFFEVQQSRHPIMRSEARRRTNLVLQGASHEVAGDSDIENARPAAHEVGVVDSWLLHRHQMRGSLCID